MPKRLLYVAGAALTLIGFGCAEATGPRTPAGSHDLAIVVPQLQLNAPGSKASGLRPRAEEIIPPDGSGGEPDYNQVAVIDTYWTDAGFAANGDGYSQAYMRFMGTDYDETTTVHLDFNGKPLDSRPGESAGSYFWPLSYHEVWANAPIGINGTCGYSVSGNSSHHAWNSFLSSNQSFARWGDVTNTSAHDPVSQPSCPPKVDSAVTPAPSDGGGGTIDDGSGSGYMVCYWADYYDAAGNWLYREDLGCSPIIWITS